MNKIERVEAKNFIIFDEFSVDLGDGVFFITGENRDEADQISNGAGKTAFCTSIVWCLFEDNLRKGMLKDEVIGSNESYCKVSVEFSEGEDEYKVTRYRQHPDYGNDVFFEINGKDVSHQTSKKKTTEKIQNELSLSKNIIYYCAYLSNSTESLVSLAPYKMKKVVSDLINISPLKEWVSDIKSIKSDKEMEIDRIQNKIDSKKEIYSSEKSTLETLENDLKEYLDNKEKKIEKIKEKINHKKEDIQNFEESLEDIDIDEERYEELERLSEEIDEYKEKLTRKRTALRNIKDNIQTCINELNKVNRKIEKYEDYLSNLTENTEGECKVCGNELRDSDKIRSKIDKFQRKIDDLQPRKEDLKLQKNKFVNKRSQVQSNVNKLKKNLQERRDAYKEFKDLERKIDNYKNIKRLKKSAEEDLNDFYDQIKELNDYPVEKKRKRISDKKDKIDSLEDKINELDESLNTVNNKINASDFLIDCVKQIRKDKLNNFIDNFDKIVNKNLNKLTNGDYKCKVVEDDGDVELKFTNISKDGKYLNYHLFSEGEKVRINKAVVASLSDIIDVGFMIDDEGFSGLDSVGVSGIMDFVLEKNRGKTLLFVGHGSKVKDEMEEYKNIHIIKENGTSSVEVK